MSQLKHELRQHLGRALGIDTRTLDDDTELFSSGLIDALSVLDLVHFIELHSGVRIAPDAISLENLDSLERIDNLVGQLQSVQHEQRA